MRDEPCPQIKDAAGKTDTPERTSGPGLRVWAMGLSFRRHERVAKMAAETPIMKFVSLAFLLMALLLESSGWAQTQAPSQLPLEVLRKVGSSEGISLTPEGLVVVGLDEVWSVPWSLVDSYDPESGRIGLPGTCTFHDSTELMLFFYSDEQKVAIGQAIAQAAGLKLDTDLQRELRDDSVKGNPPAAIRTFRPKEARASLMVPFEVMARLHTRVGVWILPEGLVVRSQTRIQSIRWEAVDYLRAGSFEKSVGLMINASPTLSLKAIALSTEVDERQDARLEGAAIKEIIDSIVACAPLQASPDAPTQQPPAIIEVYVGYPQGHPVIQGRLLQGDKFFPSL